MTDKSKRSEKGSGEGGLEIGQKRELRWELDFRTHAKLKRQRKRYAQLTRKLFSRRPVACASDCSILVLSFTRPAFFVFPSTGMLIRISMDAFIEAFASGYLQTRNYSARLSVYTRTRPIAMARTGPKSPPFLGGTCSNSLILCR